MKNTNTNHIPTNGNCKRVRDITINKTYGSFTEAALVNGVSLQAISQAVNKKSLCNGHRFVLESELYKSHDLLCEESAKANAREAKAHERASRAEAKVAEMEAELSEYRQWKAEQEAARKAEEKKQEKISKLEKKLAIYDRMFDQCVKRMEDIALKRSDIEAELNTIKGNGGAM